MDRLAAVLLMPGFMVRAVLENYSVSYIAFLIRLKELHLLARHDISEYIISEIGLGNEAVAI